jgi:thioredoxin 1
MNRYLTRTAALAVAALALAACGSSTTANPPAAGSTPVSSSTPSDAMTPTDKMTDTMTHSDEMTHSDDMAKGRYISYEEYTKDMAMAAKGASVVLFFHAPWCPDCKATDASLTTDGVPDGLTVVKVDYDSMTELKQKYGITQQHTFVAVDAEGMKQNIWTGTTTGEQIKAKLA